MNAISNEHGNSDSQGSKYNYRHSMPIRYSMSNGRGEYVIILPFFVFRKKISKKERRNYHEIREENV